MSVIFCTPAGAGVQKMILTLCISFVGRDKSPFFPAHPPEKKKGCEDTSLLSDHLGEARTKFVGGLNITSREGFGRPPLTIPFFPTHILLHRPVSSQKIGLTSTNGSDMIVCVRGRLAQLARVLA
jgi:hypothetical protein